MKDFPIKRITFKDKNYPQILKKIPHFPKILYFKGKTILKKGEKAIAIVGTRRYSSYGKAVAFEMVSSLARAGLTIVSGLAPGIDTFAHQFTLEAGGKTIAVLGTGLDEKVIYPRSNLSLAKRILQGGGVLLSEFPPKTPGSKFTFPKRNRIISGLSLGVLVIEADERSGALITANYAKIQKRKVFAIPGSIFSKKSRGTNKLIKEGAILVTKAEEILKIFKIKEEKREEKEGGFEGKILKFLKEGPLTFDQLIERIKISSSQLLVFLSSLEAKGLIKDLGGKYIRR